MFSSNIKRLIKIGLVGAACTGTVLSLKSNNYDVNSVGVVRLGRAAKTVFDISLNYKSNLYDKKLDKTCPEYKELKSKCHKQAAEKLLDLCCTNKGVYIKVGQHIAALDYLLPREYVQTMRILHSHAPATNLKDILRVIREELGKDPDELFVKIDPEPVGAASLAQVHRAVLHDGTVVAVKVQHPYVKGNAIVDMQTMEILVKIVSWIFPDFKFQWLVDETKRNIPRELDFSQEGHNAERLANIYCVKYKWLTVPKVFWELSTSRVLTMEYVDGGQVNDLKYIQKQGINPIEVSNKLGTLYSDMIFNEGFMHSDPHPGNILVRKSKANHCEIVLLDHGLYAELNRDFRTQYAELWLSILNVDRPAMKSHCTQLGIRPEMYGLFTCMVTGRSWDSVLAGVDRGGPRSKSESEIMRNELPNVLPQISGILDSVNRQMLLVLKTNDLLRGIEYALGTYEQKSSFKTMSHRCIRAAYAERMRLAEGTTSRFTIAVAQYWILFKFAVYYAMMNLLSLRHRFIVTNSPIPNAS